MSAGYLHLARIVAGPFVRFELRRRDDNTLLRDDWVNLDRGFFPTLHPTDYPPDYPAGMRWRVVDRSGLVLIKWNADGHPTLPLDPDK